MPKTRMDVRPGPVEMMIGEPISTTGIGMDGKEALRQRVQEAVETMFAGGARK